MTSKKKTTSFYSSRIRYQATSTADAGFIFRLFNSPKWLAYIGDRGIHTTTDAEAYIEQNMLPPLETLGYSTYTMILKDGGEKIGICGLYNRPWFDGVDVGFALLPEFEGKGYAMEGLIQTLRLGFEHFELSEVKAIVSQQNEASLGLLEKVGMKILGLQTIPNSKEEVYVLTMKSPFME